MERFKQLLANHKGAVALAVLISVLVALPQIYFRIDHRSDGVYQGIELFPDNPWSPRVREIMDGHGFGGIYYKDGKNDPYLFQPLGSMTVAYMGEAFNLNINDTFLLSRFVLPFITFLLIYGFVFLLSRSRLVALSSASLIVLADSVMNPSALVQLLHGVSPSNFITIGQPANPAMIFIPVFGFLIAFWLFYQKRDWRWGVASAVILGLNFYNYFYSWTYLYAFGGVLVLFYLVQKRWSEAVRLGSVFLGALVVAIPYGINLYQASQYPTFADAGMRLGILFTRAPLSVGFIVIATFAVFLVGFPREDRRRYFFGLALLLAPLITMNQQLLTGKEMQAAHYHWYFHKPMAVIFAVVVIFYLLGRSKIGWYKNALAAVIVIASLAVGASIQVESYFRGTIDGGSVAIAKQQYGPVMRWLNQNATKEEVVLTNDPIAYAVTVYTPLNTFYHRAAMLSLAATKERLLDTLFTFYRLRGVAAADAREVFFAERAHISTNIYGIYYRQLSGSYESIPDAEIEDILARYEETLATPASEWLKQTMGRYEVNYVVWDKKADPDWQLQEYSFLHEMVAFGDIAIYTFRP